MEKEKYDSVNPSGVKEKGSEIIDSPSSIMQKVKLFGQRAKWLAGSPTAIGNGIAKTELSNAPDISLWVSRRASGSRTTKRESLIKSQIIDK